MGDLTKNFSKKEFACPCCGLDNISIELVERLQMIRNYMVYVKNNNFKIIIASGVRCEKHNKDIGGSDTSSHLATKTKFSCAADLHIPDGEYGYIMLEASLHSGFQRIGYGMKNGKIHFHVDCDWEKPFPRLWGY